MKIQLKISAEQLKKKLNITDGKTPVAGIDFPLPNDGKDYILTEKDKIDIANGIKVPVVERIIEKTIVEQPMVTREIIEAANTRIQIVESINTGTESDLKIALEQILGFEKLEKRIMDRAISILDQRTQFLINRSEVNSLNGLIGNLNIVAGSNITVTASGSNITIASTGGGGGTPGGSDTQVQFNDAGSFGGDAGMTYNKTTDALTIAGITTGEAFVPSGSTVPTNGMYLPAANKLGWAINSASELLLDSAAVYPAVDRGLTAGTPTSGFSALHLGSGGNIYFRNDIFFGDNGASADSVTFQNASGGWSFSNPILINITNGAIQTIGGVSSYFQQLGTTSAEGRMTLGMFNATAGTSAGLDFYRSKNATYGSATVVAQNDVLGQITAWGAQQTGTFATQNPAAQWRMEVDLAVTSGAGADMPGRHVWATTANGSGTLTDRLILDSTGTLKPNTNDGVALGTSALGFSDLFLAAGGVIQWKATGGNTPKITDTGAGNQLAFTGSLGGYTFDSLVSAAFFTSAGDYLLPAGGKINWNSGGVLIQESSDALNFTGAGNGYSFDNSILGTNFISSGLVRVVGTNSSDTFSWDNATTAPTPQGLLSLPLQVYGAGTINEVLGTPDAWVVIDIASSLYKIPLYS